MKAENVNLRMNVGCPSCNGPIRVSLEELNSETELVCPNCGLKIKLTHGTDGKASKILDKFKNQ